MWHRLLVIGVASLIACSCGQSRPTDNSGPFTQNRSGGTASSAFAKKSYYALGRRQAIKIMSSTEIELQLGDDNIVGSYEREGNRIRAVIETLGTKQSQYFIETSEGLRAERDGSMFYTEEALAAIELRQIQDQEQARARQAALAIEQEQLEAAKARAREVHAVTFKCGPVRDFSGYGTEMISVTDASVIGVNGVRDSSVAFVDVQYLSNFDADTLDGPGIWVSDREYNRLGSWGFRFRGPAALANRDACHDAIVTSYQKWRRRFPELAQLPDLSAEEGAGAKRIAAAEAQARQREEQRRADIRTLEGTDCGTESATVVVSKAETREFVVSPQRTCWTPWLVVAEGGRFGGTTEKEGNVLMEVVFVDGTTREPFEDGPRTNVRLAKAVRKARFKTLGRESVTVTFRVQ